MGDPTDRARVLLVDDDQTYLFVLEKMLREDGYDIAVAHDAPAALAALGERAFDVVVSDMLMPGMDGIALLDEIRRRDLDVPVVFLTGVDSAETADRVLEQGAFRYLVKPVSKERLRKVVRNAAHIGTAQRVRREVAAPPPPAAHAPGAPATRERFLRALAGMYMDYQPLISAQTRETVGYEALLRSHEPTLELPFALLDAAERLGAIHLLGRSVRRHVATTLTESRATGDTYVNLHPADLADEELYRADAPLTEHASHVVLEITERASLEGVGDVRARVDRLRGLGYRIAVDDLGAGYAGLSVFAALSPDVVKLDMSLVRGIDTNPIKQRVVKSMVALARDLGTHLIVEGVERPAERDALVEFGCAYLQGHLFARPGPPFPVARWG